MQVKPTIQNTRPLVSTHIALTGAALTGLMAISACTSPPIPEGWESLGPRQSGHIGPSVDGGGAGTARFIEPVLELFEVNAAMGIARVLDSERRSPASDGYEKAIDRVIAELYGAGFGDGAAGGDEGFSLEVLAEPMAQPAWTAVSARIQAEGTGPQGRRQRVTLAQFDGPGHPDRTMLPEGVASFQVEGKPVFRMGQVGPGSILVTDQSVKQVEKEAEERGASAVVSSFLLPYATDPTGENRQFDAIFDGSVRQGSTMPSMYVSPRTAQNIRITAKNGARFILEGKVKTAVRDLRTVTATIEGSDLADQVVYVVSHVSGAGANDNAAGAGGMVELARTIKRLIAAGRIERPRRSIRFVFGNEADAGGTVLEHFEDRPVAGIVADMVGAGYARTGAICLLERGWDPGAVVPLAPDAHTPWGAGSVAEEDIIPNGLSIVLRQALVDVGDVTLAKGGVPWSTREHPWEGGSDHDAFLDRGIAAALVWHFTDFSYSTNLDRMENIDPAELRRTTVAIGAAALAVADLQPMDLQRHLDSLNLDARVRMDAARADGNESLQTAWKDWFDGARSWLRTLASGDAPPELDPIPEIDRE